MLSFSFEQFYQLFVVVCQENAGDFGVQLIFGDKLNPIVILVFWVFKLNIQLLLNFIFKILFKIRIMFGPNFIIIEHDLDCEIIWSNSFLIPVSMSSFRFTFHVSNN